MNVERLSVIAERISIVEAHVGEAHEIFEHCNKHGATQSQLSKYSSNGIAYLKAVRKALDEIQSELAAAAK
jgi:outer membrane PBP1 activator LpoA protein